MNVNKTFSIQLKKSNASRRNCVKMCFVAMGALAKKGIAYALMDLMAGHVQKTYDPTFLVGFLLKILHMQCKKKIELPALFVDLSPLLPHWNLIILV